jgi:hypothetical protein
MMRTLIMMSMIALVMGACSDKSTQPGSAIPDAQLQALEKARSLEAQLKKHHDEAHKQLDQE